MRSDRPGRRIFRCRVLAAGGKLVRIGAFGTSGILCCRCVNGGWTLPLQAHLKVHSDKNTHTNFYPSKQWPANLLVNDRRNLASTRGLAVILLSLVYGATTFHRTNVRHLSGSRRETLVAGGCD